MSARRWTMARVVPLVMLLGGIPGCGGTDDALPSEGYVRGAAGAELHYRVVGSGADTVVVVHGGPGAGINSVLPDFEPLSRSLTLLFYDQRGGGRSTLPADTSLLRAEYFVADLDSVRASFGLDRMRLLAHSFGAVLVARYAESHPERIGRIVLHGATGPVRAAAARQARATPPSPDTSLSRRANEMLGSLLEGTAEAPVETCREWMRIGRRLAELRGETARWRGSSCEAPAEAVAYYFRYTAQHAPRTFGDWDFTDQLGEVSAPVLVLSGSRDSLDLAAQRAWAAAYPNARLLTVGGAGKTAAADTPLVVRPAVVEFLQGAWPDAARPADESSYDDGES